MMPQLVLEYLKFLNEKICRRILLIKATWEMSRKISISQFFMYTGGSLTEKRMVAEMATLFFAGSDTTAHTAAWAL